MQNNTTNNCEVKYFDNNDIGEYEKDDLKVRFVGTYLPTDSKHLPYCVFEVITNGEKREDILNNEETTYLNSLCHKKFNFGQIGKQLEEVQNFYAEKYYDMIK